MRRERKIAILFLLVAVICTALRIYWVVKVQPIIFMQDRMEMWRSMYVGYFWNYPNEHGGEYPKDLTEFANAPPPAQSSGSEYRQPDWKSFYYVSGLTRNDPIEMPLIIYIPENKRITNGMVGFVAGHGMLLPLDTAQRLIREPWGVTRDGKPLDEQTKKVLKKRIKVLPPIRDQENNSSKSPLPATHPR